MFSKLIRPKLSHIAVVPIWDREKVVAVVLAVPTPPGAAEISSSIQLDMPGSTAKASFTASVKVRGGTAVITTAQMEILKKALRDILDGMYGIWVPINFVTKGSDGQKMQVPLTDVQGAPRGLLEQLQVPKLSELGEQDTGQYDVRSLHKVMKCAPGDLEEIVGWLGVLRE